MRPYEHSSAESEAADQVWALVVGMAPDDAAQCRLMDLQAYIDDSRKDGLIVLAGHIASVENWALLSKEWTELLPLTHLNKHDRREFKMSMMMATPEGIENIQPFYRLIEQLVDVSLSISISEHDIERAQSLVLIDGQRPRLREKYKSPFIMAYRYLMDNFHSKRAEIGHWIDPNATVDFVFDQDGAGPVLMAGWAEYVSKRSAEEREIYGQAPVFRDSEKFKPLQAADLWAGWVRKCYENGDIPNIHARDFGSWKAKPGHRIMRKECTQDEIAQFLVSVLRPMSGDAPITYNGIEQP